MNTTNIPGPKANVEGSRQNPKRATSTVPKYIFLIAGLGLAEICRLNTPVRAADEPYPPTKDTGPHNPLEPKPTPDNGSTIGLVIISGLALLGAQRWRSNELRFRCRDGSTNDNRFI